jgi:leader peptidase (prepilin peptidase)/N-methyltransferase
MKEIAVPCALNSAFLYVLVASLGAIIGSFLSVCIYRIPYGRPKGPPNFEEEESEEEPPQPTQTTPKIGIANPPRSFCPSCQTQLLWCHNIPILSWLLLRGKCYFCKVSISPRYPLVEFLSLICALLSVQMYGFSMTALVIYLFCAALIVISFIDIDYYIIPDVISLPGTVIGMLLATANHFLHIFEWPLAKDFWTSLIGVAVGGGGLLLISELYYRIRKRVGLGLGDVKLLAMVGAFFGFEGAFATIFYGSLLGSVIGVFLIIFFKRGASQHLPFGPYLALGTLIYIFTKRVLFY